MEWVVTVGKSVEEAKDAALDQLGVDEDDAEFEILEEPRPGLFGRIRGEARVRARIKPAVPRPKVERRDKRRRNGGGSGSGGSGSGSGGRAGRGRNGGTKDAGTKDTGPKDAGAKDRQAKADATDDAHVAVAETTARTEAVVDETGDTADRTSARTVRPRGRSGGRGPGERAAADTPADDRRSNDTTTDAIPASDDPTPPGGTDMSDTTLTLDEQAAMMVEFLEGLLEAFEVEGETSTETIDDENAEIRVDGADLGLLIGPKGNTLSAVQELARTVVQRRAAHAEGRVRIDIGGYRQRRREALERFTRQVAEDVKSTGVQKALEPMHPADRKVVHDVANTIEGVRTLSEGEEPRRRVVIIPD